jgi:hypothetical protein
MKNSIKDLATKVIKNTKSIKGGNTGHTSETSTIKVGLCCRD